MNKEEFPRPLEEVTEKTKKDLRLRILAIPKLSRNTDELPVARALRNLDFINSLAQTDSGLKEYLQRSKETIRITGIFNIQSLFLNEEGLISIFEDNNGSRLDILLTEDRIKNEWLRGWHDRA